VKVGTGIQYVVEMEGFVHFVGPGYPIQVDLMIKIQHGLQR
jgi:hypothetical protein